MNRLVLKGRRYAGLFISVLSITLLNACTLTSASTQSSYQAWPNETIQYQCADGTVLQVAYFPDGDQAALWYQGQLSLLRLWPAASGVRYISVDEQIGYRWHVKADEGMLLWLAPDHTAQEEVLHEACKEKPRTPVGGGEQGF